MDRLKDLIKIANRMGYRLQVRKSQKVYRDSFGNLLLVGHYPYGQQVRCRGNEKFLQEQVESLIMEYIPL